jgi:TolA-binding protein
MIRFIRNISIKPLLTLVFACSFNMVSAQQDTGKVKELEQTVKELEGRLAKMENRTANMRPTAEARKMMLVARRHIESEKKIFSAEDIEKVEKLYHRAAKKLSENESKPLLDSIVTHYPKFNRAGCAQLYRAQQESGQEKERLLKDCIDRFNTCYYYDGAQVGPLAMLQLAFYYQSVKNESEAHKLFKRLRNKYPNAVGHNGELLTDKIN